MALPLLICTSLCAKYGFEYHSYNDMRQWPALINRKDVNTALWLKIDPHYSNDMIFCNDQGFDSNDCMVLSHDIMDTSGEVKYNTTNQLINEIKIFPKGTHIALCAKFIGDPCASYSWIKFSQKLFEKLTPVAQAAGITIVLDGAFTPAKDCLHDQFLPWNSTNLPTDLKSATSNEGYHGRLQILNMPMTKPNPFTVIASVNPPFGKYQANQPGRPFLVWEPMSEKQIRQVRTQFDAVAPSDTDIVRFANNQDPFQLLNYLYSTEVNSSVGSIVSSNGQIFRYNNGMWNDNPKLTEKTITQIEIQGSNNVVAILPAGFVRLVTVSDSRNVSVSAVSIQLSQQSIYIITSNGSVLLFNTTTCDLDYIHSSSIGSHKVSSGVFLGSFKSLLYTMDSSIYLEGVSTPIGVGTKVKGVECNNEILISVKDSFCYNNDKYNKQPRPKLCDLKGTSTENVASLAIIPANVKLDQIIFHPCNQHIVFAGIGVLSEPFPTVSGKIFYTPLNGSCKASVCGCPVVSGTGNLKMFDISHPLG